MITWRILFYFSQLMHFYDSEEDFHEEKKFDWVFSWQQRKVESNNQNSQRKIALILSHFSEISMRK
jgi:hypothetical protein